MSDKKTGFRLSDGTTLDELVPGNGERSVAGRIMSDQEVYRLELERIFDKTWIFVAHESEIPEKDDFVTRYIGEDPVIVSRLKDGGFSVLLNSCSHRGPRVCMADRGTSGMFRCPYHGWVYKNTGELFAVPGEKTVYGEGLCKDQLGLKQARVDAYHGLIFATWNEAAPSLKEFLGPITVWLDVVFGLGKNGMKVAGPPHRWVLPCNWKMGADNFNTDNYHPLATHQSVAEAGALPGLDVRIETVAGRANNAIDVERGHSIASFISPTPEMPEQAYLDIGCEIAGVPRNMVQELRETLTEDQVGKLLRSSGSAGNVWPNLSWIRSPCATGEGNPSIGALTIRLWQPHGPEHMEAWSWSLLYKDAPDDVNAAERQALLRTFGPSGTFESDDAEIWINMQKAMRGVQGRKRRMIYNAQGKKNPNVEAPLEYYNGQISDDNQWHFYTTWRHAMQG